MKQDAALKTKKKNEKIKKRGEKMSKICSC
jgi:hypothetical protein